MLWLEEVRAAGLRLQKMHQLLTLEAMHASNPKEMRAALLASLAPQDGSSAFQQLLARATPAA